MKVYVLELGMYEDREIEGVFATLEAAMTAHRALRVRRGLRGIPAWKEYDGSWEWGTDHFDSARINEYVVQDG